MHVTLGEDVLWHFSERQRVNPILWNGTFLLARLLLQWWSILHRLVEEDSILIWARNSWANDSGGLYWESCNQILNQPLYCTKLYIHHHFSLFSYVSFWSKVLKSFWTGNNDNLFVFEDNSCTFHELWAKDKISKKLIKIRNNRGIWRVELQILALNGLDQLISLLDNR